jgi:chloride channel protein, CIC family
MTSVFMIFEITQDYQILVPLMVANMLSYLISKRYQPTPVYHALLQQDGVHLPSASSQTPVAARTAQHVMRSDVEFLAPDLSVEQARQWATERDAPVFLVGSRDRLEGSVTRQQLEQWFAAGQRGDAVSSFVHAHPDHPLDVVLERLAQSGGVLPVVSRAEARRVEGVITPETILTPDGQRMHARRSSESVAARID